MIGPPAGALNGGASAVPAGAMTGSAAGARKAPRRSGRASSGGGAGGDSLVSPIQGTVLRVAVEAGAAVTEGALVCVIEAMKMENEITAHKAGTVTELPISVGGSVATGETVAVITTAAE